MEMRQSSRFTLVVLILCFVYCCSDALDHKLLIISFDGFRWNYIGNRTNTPNFDRFIRNGVHAQRGIQDAFITKTFPNHMTLVTGLWEESHQIISNHMYDPYLNQSFSPGNKDAIKDPSWWNMGSEPIWVTNQLQRVNGLSGSIMWVGGDAPIKWTVPSRYIPYSHKFKHEAKIDTMIKWMKDRYPVNLGLMYFDQPDYIAHETGPESQNVTEMIEELDGVVGYLLKRFEKENLLDSTNVILTSDHGFVSTPKDKIINLNKFIDPRTFDVYQGTPIASIWPKPGKEEEIFKNLSEAAIKSGHFKVIRKEDIPEHFHYKHSRRISPIQVVADLFYSFNISHLHTTNVGDHGYDNRRQEMHPFFLAMGPDFRKDFSVETFSSVDVYPLMCHLLGLIPAPNNGSMNIVSRLLVSSQAAPVSTTTTLTFVLAGSTVAIVACLFLAAVWRLHLYVRRKRNSQVNEEQANLIDSF